MDLVVVAQCVRGTLSLWHIGALPRSLATYLVLLKFHDVTNDVIKINCAGDEVGRLNERCWVAQSVKAEYFTVIFTEDGVLGESPSVGK